MASSSPVQSSPVQPANQSSRAGLRQPLLSWQAINPSAYHLPDWDLAGIWAHSHETVRHALYCKLEGQYTLLNSLGFLATPLAEILLLLSFYEYLSFRLMSHPRVNTTVIFLPIQIILRSYLPQPSPKDSALTAHREKREEE